MKLNRKWILVMSLVLSVALATGGTLAYLTDSEIRTNVMTLGLVDITLNEQQRKAGTTDLEDFQQGKTLLPLVGSVQDDTKQMIDFNGTTIGMPHPDKAKNYVDKIVSVTNNAGSQNAYVRVLFAFPALLDDEKKASNMMMHWNFPASYDANNIKDNGIYSQYWQYVANESSVKITIDGLDYYIYNYVYQEVLEPGNTTVYPVMEGIYLDERVDAKVKEDGSVTYSMKIGENEYKEATFAAGQLPQLIVLAQAVQASGFEDADEALEAGFGKVTVANAEEWFQDEKSVFASPDSGAVRPAGYNPSESTNPVVKGVTVIDNSDANTNLRALYFGTGNTKSGDLTIEDSYLDGTYAMNPIGNDTGVLKATNTAFRGWVSYDGYNSATFTNCSFGENSNPEIYNNIRPYSTVTFIDCEFDGTTFWLDKVPSDAVVTFTNCTMNGNEITKENDITIVKSLTSGARINFN